MDAPNDKNFREMLKLLSGEESPKGEVPAGVVEAAKKAGVLELLGREPALRAALGKDGSAFLYHAVLGSASLKELEHLAETLAGKKIPVVVLKGMAYALMFERGGPTRSMADIDLLLPEESYEEACRLVMNQGYREIEAKHPMSRNREHYNERIFIKGEVMFEVHRWFLTGERIAVDYRGLWARTRSAGDECPDCRLLSAEDTFLYHCFHMGFHEFLHGLRPVWELRRLLLQDKPDLEIAARRAREWGTLAMTWCALRLLEACFPGVLAGTDLKRFKPVMPRAKLLEQFVVRPSLLLLQDPNPEYMPRPVQLFRKAMMVDRPVGAAKYLLLWVKGNMKAKS